MNHPLRRWPLTLVLVGMLALASKLPAGPRSAPEEPPTPPGSITLPDVDLAGDPQIVHLLNRIGFGPRPGDVERIRQRGVQAHIERQLNPEAITDEALGRKLVGLDTLRMSTRDLLIAYPPPALLRGIERQVTTRMGMDPDAAGELFPELERIRRRREMQERATGEGASGASEMSGDLGGEQRGPEERLRELLRGPGRIAMELAQAKLLRAVYSERQLLEVMTDFWFNHFNVYVGKGADRWLTSSYEYEAIRPHALGKFRDMLGATARHPAMLFYLDNWLSSDPGARVDPRELQLIYAGVLRGKGIQPHGVVLEILRSRGVDTTALERRIERSSQRPRRLSRGAGQGRRPAGENDRTPRRRGLNENYARELLELHTLGVDGGYTQKDILDVARCFTGWTLMPPQHGQQFVYLEEFHDRGTKVVLGRKIKNRGMKDGEAVLDLLASHPSTARFISYKLARRFVSDDPPDSLVESMAGTFLETDGDIRSVLRTLFGAEEFWSPDAVRAKLKTPFEFVVSAARATQARLAGPPGSKGGAPPGLVFALRKLGQPLYAAQPPTGYKDSADAWVSAGALLGRMKLALGLAADRLPGVRFEVPDGLPATGSARDLLAAVGKRLMGQEPSPETLDALTEQLESLSPIPKVSRQAKERLALGWILASAEFQRR